MVVKVSQLEEYDKYLTDQIRKIKGFEHISLNQYISIRFESKGISCYLIEMNLGGYINRQRVMFDDLYGEDTQEETKDGIYDGRYICKETKAKFIGRGGLEIYHKYFKENKEWLKRN